MVNPKKRQRRSTAAENRVPGSNERLTEADSEELLKNLELVNDLRFFLMTAPVNWHQNQVIRRYYLNNSEGFVSCVYWDNLYFVTGTDIVRCIAYKMRLLGRRIVDRKKLEEGIFSDLRSLKCGTDAVLERPKSEFLHFLHRNQCLRTQKKQKVFFWFSVPHDKLFLDALERDIEKEASGTPGPSTVSETSFAKGFRLAKGRPFKEQLIQYLKARTGKDYAEMFEDSKEQQEKAVQKVEKETVLAASKALQGDSDGESEISSDSESEPEDEVSAAANAAVEALHPAVAAEQRAAKEKRRKDRQERRAKRAERLERAKRAKRAQRAEAPADDDDHAEAAKADSAPELETEQNVVGSLSLLGPAGSDTSSDDQFPMDYADDPVLYDVDGIGSVAEIANTEFTYAQEPGSAFIADHPSMWLVSPKGVRMPDDLLLDQATPVMPMFQTSAITPRGDWPDKDKDSATSVLSGAQQSFYSLVPEAARGVSGGIPSAGAFMGLTPTGGLISAGVAPTEGSASATTNTATAAAAAAAAAAATNTTTTTFASPASAGTATATGLTGPVSAGAAASAGPTITPQVLTVPMGGPGQPIVGSALASQFFSPVYYSGSPCYADYPVLPFSRPLSGIQSTFEERRAKRTAEAAPTSLDGVASKASKRQKFINPALRHAGVKEEVPEEFQ